MRDCFYFRAYLEKEKIVSFVGLLFSFEDNVVFARIEKAKECVFEFFVSPFAYDLFISIMDLFLEKNIIIWYKKEDIFCSSVYDYQS